MDLFKIKENRYPSPSNVRYTYNYITTSGIDALLSNLNAHKAAGSDGIIARVLKEMHIKD